MLDLARLGSGVQAILGRHLSSSESAQFGQYFELLVRWQRVHRLVGSTDSRWVVDHVLIDSLLFSSFLPSPNARVLDFGSGAGIPGVPLAITHPGLRVTLLEPRRRRASFLGEVVRTLGLSEARVLALRSEDVLTEHPDLASGFDVVVSRCSGSVGDGLPEAHPFMAPGGRLVLSGPPEPRRIESGEWSERRHPTLARSRWFHVSGHP